MIDKPKQKSKLPGIILLIALWALLASYIYMTYIYYDPYALSDLPELDYSGIIICDFRHTQGNDRSRGSVNVIDRALQQYIYRDLKAASFIQHNSYSSRTSDIYTLGNGIRDKHFKLDLDTDGSCIIWYKNSDFLVSQRDSVIEGILRAIGVRVGGVFKPQVHTDGEVIIGGNLGNPVQIEFTQDNKKIVVNTTIQIQ